MSLARNERFLNLAQNKRFLRLAQNNNGDACNQLEYKIRVGSQKIRVLGTEGPADRQWRSPVSRTSLYTCLGQRDQVAVA